MPALESGLASFPLAVILDVDSVPLDNHAIRNLKASNPAVSFLMVSRERFHPELQESISHVLYACLKKPADTDEIIYLLKSIWDHEVYITRHDSLSNNLTEKGSLIWQEYYPPRICSYACRKT